MNSKNQAQIYKIDQLIPILNLPVPFDKVLDNMGEYITATEKNLLKLLNFQSKIHGFAYPSLEYLGKQLGRHPDTIRKIISGLKRKKLVVVESAAHRDRKAAHAAEVRNNNYYLIWHTEYDKALQNAGIPGGLAAQKTTPANKETETSKLDNIKNPKAAPAVVSEKNTQRERIEFLEAAKPLIRKFESLPQKKRRFNAEAAINYLWKQRVRPDAIQECLYILVRLWQRIRHPWAWLRTAGISAAKNLNAAEYIQKQPQKEVAGQQPIADRSVSALLAGVGKGIPKNINTLKSRDRQLSELAAAFEVESKYA